MSHYTLTGKIMDRIKYDPIFTEIIQTCLELERIGYFISTWGNVSVRVDEGLIVTPSKMAYDTITNDDFLVLSTDGAVLSGHRIPTSEADIHRLVLNKRKDINAIVHSHSLCATAIACLHRSIPPFVEDLVQIVGGEVKCTRYVPAGQHLKIAQETADTIGDVNAVLLANHGAMGCGRTLGEALIVCKIVEKAAQMMLMAGPMGTVQNIPDEFVKSERYRFLYKYGTKSDHPQES
jgi:L-ribulose-5-phosphate 4-epimerase